MSLSAALLAAASHRTGSVRSYYAISDACYPTQLRIQYAWQELCTRVILDKRPNCQPTLVAYSLLVAIWLL
jgi:hypothetical protein